MDSLAEDGIMLAAEVAELFRVGKITVYRWADAGILPRLDLPNGMHRFRRSDVMRLIESTGQPAA